MSEQQARHVLDLALGEQFEFWIKENRKTLLAAADDLLAHGYSASEAGHLIGSVFGAASAEYGA